MFVALKQTTSQLTDAQIRFIVNNIMKKIFGREGK